MEKDTVSTGSSQKTEKSMGRNTDKKPDKKSGDKMGKKDKKKDGKKESNSLNPERQKVVTDRYRDGWSNIWKPKD